MTEPIKLSERERAALVALADLSPSPLLGAVLASAMTRAGRGTSTAAAHQAAAALIRKGLAAKGLPTIQWNVRYEITDRGREWLAKYHVQPNGGAR